ncbi:hypothetical protein CHUAL_002736 [Chamberlinius hualienensis]
MYLFLLLVAPVVSLPSQKSMASHTGRYVKAVLGCSEELETLFRIIGFQRYDNIDPLQAARLIGPDILMLIVSVIVFVVSSRTNPGTLSRAASIQKSTIEQHEDVAISNDFAKSSHTEEEEEVPFEDSYRSSSKFLKRKAFSFLGVLGDVLAMALLASAGIIRPSITSAIYFLVFLAVATWVSCFKKLRKRYAVLRIFLIIYAAIHLVVLYLYQMPVSQQILPPDTLYARLFGLTAMVKTSCSDPRNVEFLPLEWASYVNPAILLALYWVLVLETKLWMRSPPQPDDVKSNGDGRHSSTSAAAHFQPIALTVDSLSPTTTSTSAHFVHSSNYYSISNTPRTSLQPSQSKLRRTKSEKPPSYHRRAKSVRRQPGAKRYLSYGGAYESTPLLSADGIHQRHYSALMSPLTSIFLLITRQSYIATLIVMMAWSITYHSWLTFVLLLWSCILWMMPNSRKACLRSSPALVIYAESLLIIQYIYGLNLNDAELPQKIVAVNLRQIGCVKYLYLPFVPLAIKILYTLMFWITLRQFMEERYHEKNKDLMEGVMLEPFNMACSTTQADTSNLEVQRPKSSQESPFMKRLGSFVLRVLTTYWIWVVACMLMVISLQGEKVVIYRVIEIEVKKFNNETNPVVIGIPATPTGNELPQFKVDDDDDAHKQEEEEEENLQKHWKEIAFKYIKKVGDVAMKGFETVCAVHVIFVLLVTVALPFRFLQLFVSHCCAVWSAVLLLSKMIYQIDYVDEVWTVNCTDVEYMNATTTRPYPFNGTVNNALWMGYSKVDNLPNYLKGYIGIILVLSIQAVVRVRQSYHRNQMNIEEPKTGIIFTDITRLDGDNGLIEALKYLVNFTFYKFGVEINFMTMVAAIGIRLDILSVAYAIWLGGLFLLRRTTLSKVWPFYVAFLAILLPLQYSMCVGIPPGFCIEYPWSTDGSEDSDSELREWLYLPDFEKPLPAYKLAVDFFQLLFACCQLFVFQIERSPNSESYEGGSNKELQYMNSNDPDENPIYLVKVIIFSLFYWVTLAIIFLAGTNRVSLFAMGYVIGCFLFLWNGQDFYLKPLKTILRLWNTLLAYNIFVIFIKTILQMVGCVYIKSMLQNFCWAIQLFGIACIKKFDSNYTVTKLGDCTVPEDEAGLLWDGICLGFMLMQRRLFCSYYFHHLVTEMHAQTKLASRGAELINQLLLKEVREQEAEEHEVMENIKKKMDRIRANQQKIRGKDYSDHQDHFKTNTSDVSSASTPMYSLGTPSSLQLSQQEVPDTFQTEPRRIEINHFPTYPHSNNSKEQNSSLLDRQPSSISRRRRRLRRSTRRSYQKSLSKRKIPSLPTSSPPPVTPYPHPPSSPTGGAVPSSPGSPSCTFSLDGFMEPSLSVVGAPAGLFSFGGGHPPSNIGLATPTEDSFPFFSPPPYPVATSNSIRVLQPIRSGDYFMFEDNSDDELADIDLQEKKPEDKDDDVRGMSVSKLLSSAMKRDIKQAVCEAKQVKGGQSPEAILYRQTSSDVSSKQPVSRTVSAVSGASSMPIGMSVSRQASLRSQGNVEVDRSTAFALLPPGDDKAYDSYRDGEDDDSRSPPLPPDLETALQVAPLQEEEITTEEEVEEDSLSRKILNWLKFALAFVEGLMVSATNKLNVISKDYRYVARCLAKEKKILKEKGLVSAQSLKDDRLDSSVFVLSSPQIQPYIKSREEPLEIRVEKASEDQNDGSLECLETPEELEREFEKDQPVTIRFIVALWFAMVSRSEIVCYVMIVFNQIKSASLVSLPLPFMVFLWGTLSLPRPTKTFWITIITYTEAVVVIKYLFQFEFFPWNESPKLNSPFWPPRIIGIEKKEQYAIYDLALLLVIFFHRFILKSLGLWKDDESVDSTQLKSNGEDEDSNSTDKAAREKSEEITRSSDSADIKEECEFEGDEEMEELKKWSAKECVLTYTQPFRVFFHNLFYPSYRVTVDVYAFMFLCDFATFLILVFGYWAFGPGGGDGGVTSYFEENQVPVPFLVMLIAQFALIIIDRALFLRKFILGKVIFQVAMVFIVHIWMFFVLPAVSEKDFNSSLPPQLWYLVKCIYLLLSAYQIRSGYPTRILGNFVTKKYNYINMFLFRG